MSELSGHKCSPLVVFTYIIRKIWPYCVGKSEVGAFCLPVLLRWGSIYSIMNISVFGGVLWI